MSKFNYIYTDPSALSLAAGQTPYGVYDSDETFASESINVCKWVAKRIGHPVMQLEFASGSIFAMFEEAVSEYSSHINNYNTKNWMWEHYGSTDRISGSTFNSTGSHEPETPHMGTTFILSEQYGSAVNVGGDVTLYSGSIELTSSQQVYDLQSDSAVTYEYTGSNSNIEIQRVFNYGKSAALKFYDPYAGSFDQQQMLDAMGMGNVSPAVSFILRPIHYDVSRMNAIETNDKMRKSAYSFELVNNKIRLFPVPDENDSGSKVYFQYYLRDDVTDVTKSVNNKKVSDPSNVPYKFITYSEINSSGRQWIRKYCLALSKELLGIIRSKYSTMPLPNGEVTMDGEGLKAEGREEKSALLEEIKEFLESVSLTEKSRQEQEQAESQQQVLNKAPLGIYIG